jgi:hypothetical protein
MGWDTSVVSEEVIRCPSGAKGSTLTDDFYIDTHTHTHTHTHSGAKKYLVSHQLCKFSHLKI